METSREGNRGREGRVIVGLDGSPREPGHPAAPVNGAASADGGVGP
jgi:hypothetical protein